MCYSCIMKRLCGLIAVGLLFVALDVAALSAIGGPAFWARLGRYRPLHGWTR